MCLYFLHRSFSKSHETLVVSSMTLAPLAPPVHPRDSHAPGRGPTAISRPLQELHNGDAQPAAKLAPSGSTNRADDMDTDGEIDVDDCDDREYQSSAGVYKKTQRSEFNTTRVS